MSSFVKPTKKAQKQALKPKAFQKPNPIRALREQEERRQAAAAAAAAEATASKQGTLAVSARPQCPNKACLNPNVVDGICTTCGRIADDSNIVAEVQFGETSSGAAVVQGSYIGADQGGVRSIGPAFRRVGGSDEREKSIREAKSLLQGYAQQLRLSDATVNTAVQIYKLASEANFIQGRTLVAVAAVCLYGACRSSPPCKIMLIDLADLTHIDVFKLGRIFKALNRAVPFCGNGEDPVFPEDLIYRFASKLEFHHMTNKVALDAVRLVHRMKADWMVMGRRPSGICGACLLIAARINNFRRTVREVVYIVKVTNHTIQKRLEEFTETASSELTVDDFLTMDLSTSHDPPSFYRKSEAYKKKMEEKRQKRKRKVTDDGEAERGGDNLDNVVGATSDQPTSATTVITLPNASAPDLSSLPVFNYRRDKDGYIIPPIPSKIQPDEPALLEPNSNAALDGLAKEFGDPAAGASERDKSQGENASAEPAPGKSDEKRRGAKPQLPVTEDWEDDEADIEDEISEIMNDPETYEHAKAFGNAEQRARVHSMWALQQQPPKDVSMAPDVGEDEFANDPEVMNCILTPEEAKIKELLWVNENKEWLRLSQERVFRKKMEAQRPKATRKRKKKPRMGEGQTTPASTPGEAAVSVMKERGWSKRINYDAIKNMFDEPGRPGPGSVGGSEITSRRTSLAGSIFGANEGSEQAEDSAPEDEEYGEDFDNVNDDDEEAHTYDDDDQDVEEDDDMDDGDIL